MDLNSRNLGLPWEGEVLQGRLLRRYQRFFAEVEIENKKSITAHVPNTGSLLGLTQPDTPCLVSHHPSTQRKLEWTLRALQTPKGTWVGVDTQIPTKVWRNIMELHPEWIYPGIQIWKAEWKIPHEKARLDGYFETRDGKKGFIEIKNVTLGQFDTASQKMVAFFPDAPTPRGQKHLQLLTKLSQEGHIALLIFFIQRNDVQDFRPAGFIDPKYSEAYFQALRAGVIPLFWKCQVNRDGIWLETVAKKLPF